MELGKGSMVGHDLPGKTERSSDVTGTDDAACVLVLGRGSAASLAQAQVLGGKTEIASIPALNAEIMAVLRPEWVIFPLIEDQFDAAYVIETLKALGYTGRACVISPILPNRRMVEVELRSIYPVLNFLLIETPE
jgi:hypothetical protein